MVEGKNNKGDIVQLTKTLTFTENELKDRVNLYLTKAPQELYHGEIV